MCIVTVFFIILQSTYFQIRNPLIILSQSCLSLNLSYKQIRILSQIDSEFLCLYFYLHKIEPQKQYKCLVLSVLIAYRYAHARASCKLEGTGYEHLQFFSKSVLPFKHSYNLATCYYHWRVGLIFFITRVTNIHFFIKIQAVGAFYRRLHSKHLFTITR